MSKLAFADAPRREILILPAVMPASDRQVLFDAANAVSAELLENGQTPMPPEQAGEEFEQHWQALQRGVTPKETRALIVQAERAQYHSATGRFRKAVRHVRACLQPVRGERGRYNRRDDLARRAFDACLVHVRALMQTSTRAHAYHQAMQCRRLFLDIAPSEYLHPPEVLDLIEQVDEELRQGGGGRLQIVSRPAGCDVWVNGRPLGKTPYRDGALPFGDYHVRVDCPAVARDFFYVLELGQDAVRLDVDARRSAAVVTDPGLALSYPSNDAPAPPHQDAEAHAQVRYLAQAVGAEEVWLLGVDLLLPVVHITRLSADGGPVLARARLPWNHVNARFEADTLRTATAALLSGKDADLAPAPPEQSLQNVSPSASERRPRLPQHNGWTWAYGVLAGATYVTAWIAAVAHASSGSSDAQPLYLGAGALSAGMLLTSEWLLLPEHDGVPWWSWLGAAVGIGLASVGALAPFSGADRRTAYDDMLIFSGAPLIGMPLSYWLRDLF